MFYIPDENTNEPKSQVKPEPKVWLNKWLLEIRNTVDKNKD